MTPFADDMLLPSRLAVPAGIAHLRARHPADGWQRHRNYGRLSAFWLHVHATLRVSGAQLAETLDAFRADPSNPAQFGSAFAQQLNDFYQHLNGHHQIEDQVYFPKFRAIDPKMVIAFDLLENDHDVIHRTLAISITSARQLLGRLATGGDPLRFAADDHARDAGRLLALLTRHLADEEEIVIPAMLEHGERSVA